LSLSSDDIEWIKKPWMYSKPKNPDLLKKWRETWTKFLLRFAEDQNIHLINTMDLKRKEPFNKLNQDSFNDIVKNLIGSGYGKFWESNILRIYWLSLESWADHIFNIAKKKEKKIVKNVQGLIELEPKVVSMPKEDAKEVLNIMVKRRLARWIDKREKIIKLIE
jgi:hypothetical protein